MFFIFLVYVSAITLEALGCYISVIGLAAKTGPLIVFLAITLDFSKVMIATVLYKKWKDLHLLLKIILVPVLFFLITVTSTGTYAYLVQEFGKTTAVSEEQKLNLSILTAEKERLEKRKEVIDTQIAQLPSESVVQRRRLNDLFSTELTTITNRLVVLNQELPTAQIAALKEKGNTGTLGSIASAYNVAPDQVIKIVAFLIVLVIDPLAIVLLTVANFLVEQRKKELKAQTLLEQTPIVSVVAPPIIVDTPIVDNKEKEETPNIPKETVKTDTLFTPQAAKSIHKFSYNISNEINSKIIEEKSEPKEEVLLKKTQPFTSNIDLEKSNKDLFEYHESQKNIISIEEEAPKTVHYDEEKYWDDSHDFIENTFNPFDFQKKISPKSKDVEGFSLKSVTID